MLNRSIFRIPLPTVLAALIVFLAGILFAYISLTNHYLLRTYALDLGMFNQALYNLSQGHPLLFTLGLDGKIVPYLADHFSPVMILLTPIYIVFGNSSLLWIQVVSVMIFAYFTWRLGILFKLKPYLSALFLLLPLSCWALFAALGFDFHTNVIAAMLVIPMLYSALTHQTGSFILWWLLIILCKENMSLWMCFFLTGILFIEVTRLSRRMRNVLLLSAGLSAVYFITVSAFVMPSLHPDGINIQVSKYVGATNGLSGIVFFCLSHPLQALQLLYETPDGNMATDKIQFITLFAASGGFLWLYQPALLWMALPLFAQKFLSLNGGFWGVESQYSIEFVPLFALGALYYLKGLPTYIGIAFVFVSAWISGKMNFLEYLETHPRAKFYDPAFTLSPLNTESIKESLRKIPDGVAVSSVSNLAPRLERRSHLYHFPIIHDAQYLALLKSTISTYPLNAKNYTSLLEELAQDSTWVVWEESSDILIYQRKE